MEKTVSFPGTRRVDAGAILLIAASSLILLRPTTSPLAVQPFALRSCPLLWSRITFVPLIVVPSSSISYLIPTSNPFETRCRACSQDQSRSGF